MSSIKIKNVWYLPFCTVYRHPSLSAFIWFQEKIVLSETALSKGTYP